jgi:CRISPR-associated protein (TIGR03984 family)
MNEQDRIKFCTIEKLECEWEAYLKWVIDGAGDSVSLATVKWLLAHCHDGVTWGILKDRSWVLSSGAFPEVSPVISKNNLLELRLFGEDRELLIWRTDAGFSGRCLVDNGEPDNDNPCRPDTEKRILLGDRMVSDADQKHQNPVNGFTCVGTARGLRQAVPVECSEEDFTGGRWPLRLEVKHYFEQDKETGVVRVAVSRLVNISKV